MVLGRGQKNRGHQPPNLSPGLSGALPLPSRNQGKSPKKVPCEPLMTAWLWPYFCLSIKIEKHFKKDFDCRFAERRALLILLHSRGKAVIQNNQKVEETQPAIR